MRCGAGERGAGSCARRGLWLVLAAAIAAAPSPSWADEETAPSADDDYHTPLAGEPFDTTLFGREIHVPARDRTSVRAVTVGGTLFTPPIAGTHALPIAAVFLNQRWKDRALRAVLAGVVNEVDYAESFGWFEGLAHLANTTIPFPTAEIVDGEELEISRLRWGRAGGWIGGGVRFGVPPYEFDNDFRFQVFFTWSYLTLSEVKDTGDDLQIPHDTFEHGLRFRMRLDMLRRNLLELPHEGVAAGGDLVLTRRNRWRDFGPRQPDGRRLFRSDRTRDYLKLSGYVVWVTGVPLLSERHRLLLRAHGGWAPSESLDRFSAFRIGGGPPSTEANDLARSPYPGAVFDQFVTRSFALASAEYRLELLFFVYLHLRATLAYGTVPTEGPTPSTIRFRTRTGASYTAAMTTGLPWRSQLYLETDYDRGTVRAGEDGITVLALWSKSF